MVSPLKVGQFLIIGTRKTRKVWAEYLDGVDVVCCSELEDVLLCCALEGVGVM